MNVPQFTAAASLYRTRRHYQTSRQVIDVSTPLIRAIRPALIREDGIDCANCVGGECAQLHCFENWTHGGGGPGGPYEGPSGGVGSGGLRGPGETCWWNVPCENDCLSNERSCNDRCLADHILQGKAYDRCIAKCRRYEDSCSAACRTCT